MTQDLGQGDARESKTFRVASRLIKSQLLVHFCEQFKSQAGLWGTLLFVEDEILTDALREWRGVLQDWNLEDPIAQSTLRGILKLAARRSQKTVLTVLGTIVGNETLSAHHCPTDVEVYLTTIEA